MTRTRPPYIFPLAHALNEDRRKIELAISTEINSSVAFKWSVIGTNQTQAFYLYFVGYPGRKNQMYPQETTTRRLVRKYRCVLIWFVWPVLGIQIVGSDAKAKLRAEKKRGNRGDLAFFHDFCHHLPSSASALAIFFLRATPILRSLLQYRTTTTTNPTQLTPNLSPQLQYPTSRALLRLSHGSYNLTTSVSLTNPLRLYDNF